MKKVEKRVFILKDTEENNVESDYWDLEDIANKINEIVEYINKKEK